MMKYSLKKSFEARRKKGKLTCLCGKKLDVEVGGRYESIILPCPYCNNYMEFTKSEVEKEIS